MEQASPSPSCTQVSLSPVSARASVAGYCAAALLPTAMKAALSQPAFEPGALHNSSAQSAAATADQQTTLAPLTPAMGAHARS